MPHRSVELDAQVFIWPAWCDRFDEYEPPSVNGWVQVFRTHGRHAFRRRGTAPRGVAVGLLLSGYVTFGREDEVSGRPFTDFAETVVGQQRLALELGVKRDVIRELLQEGADGGWWTVTPRGKNQTSVTRLAVPAEAWWAELDPTPSRPRDSATGRFTKDASDDPPTGSSAEGPLTGSSEAENSDADETVKARSPGHRDGPVTGDPDGPVTGDLMTRPAGHDPAVDPAVEPCSEPNVDDLRSTTGGRVPIRTSEGQYLDVEPSTAQRLIDQGKATAA